MCSTVSLFSEAKLKGQSFRIRPRGRSNFSLAINKDFGDKLPPEHFSPLSLKKFGTIGNRTRSERTRNFCDWFLISSINNGIHNHMRNACNIRFSFTRLWWNAIRQHFLLQLGGIMWVFKCHLEAFMWYNQKY